MQYEKLLNFKALFNTRNVLKLNIFKIEINELISRASREWINKYINWKFCSYRY